MEAFSLPTQDRIIQGCALQGQDNSLATSLCHAWGFATVSRLLLSPHGYWLPNVLSQPFPPVNNFSANISQHTHLIYIHICVLDIL